MAYLEHGNWRDRPVAVAGVIAIHAGIGLVLVNGLSFVTRIVEDETLIGVNIKPDPVEDPPVEQVERAEAQPTETKQYIPETVIDINEVGQQLPPIPLPPPTPFLPDPVPPSTPSLGLDPVGVKPINSPAGWVTTNDYPAGDIRQEHEGVAGFRVVVGTDGRVKSCEITSSSGFAGLDRATCRNVERRARFDAAKDANGNKVVGTYSNEVLWQIPD